MTGRVGTHARRTVVRPVSTGVAAALVIAGCSGAGATEVRPQAAPTSTDLPSAVPTTAAPTTAAPTTAAPTTAAPTTAAPTSTPKPSSTNAARTPEAADLRAGLRSQEVVWEGSGKLAVVPGSSRAPGKGRLYQVRIEVESSLDVDRAAFADFVMTTLNDERGWTEGGSRRFARTDGDADFRVILATPQTSADICQPLQTFGKLSCREGDKTVLTMYRWVKAIPEYANNREGYRQYLINHEVGHVFGHGHVSCPGEGEPAPLMMQQTKGLKGCLPNSWPFP